MRLVSLTLALSLCPGFTGFAGQADTPRPAAARIASSELEIKDAPLIFEQVWGDSVWNRIACRLIDTTTV